MFCLLISFRLSFFITLTLTSPILEMDIGIMKTQYGEVFVIKYIDMPHNIMESVTIQCKTPLATSYEWNLRSVQGSPLVGTMNLGDTRSYEKEWERTLSQTEYPYNLVVARCVVKLGLDVMLTYIWVINKMKSNTDRPFHPIICDYPNAKCHGDKINCYYEKGKDYRGTYNLTDEGIFCQPWIATSPNIQSWAQWKTDGRGRHNYCRNMRLHRRKPWCYIDENRMDQAESARQVTCSVPRCSDCYHGDGKGFYPGLTVRKWMYPSYYGGGSLTSLVTFDTKGRKVHVSCHRATNKLWKDNYCKTQKYFHGRKNSESPDFPSCLVLPDQKPGDKDLTHFDNVNWKRLKFVTCVAPQCVVRQVWFLIVDTDGVPFVDRNGVTPVEIPLWVGKSTVIRFYHFGTTFCAGLSLAGSDKVKSYLNHLQLDCKDTPQMSQIRISDPIPELEGVYYISYIFSEGDPLVQDIEYKMGFNLILKTPTTLVLPAVVKMCPGFSAKATATVSGSFPVSRKTIQWLCSKDGKEWFDVNTEGVDDFVISTDGLTIIIKKNACKVVKIVAEGKADKIEATAEIKISEMPYLSLQRNVYEVRKDEEVIVQIECDPEAQTIWIFSSTEINKGKGANDYSFNSYHNTTTKRLTEQLFIPKMKEELEGIYTIHAIVDGCINEKLIYINIKRYR